MSNMYEIMAGLEGAIKQARIEMRQTNDLMLDINRKIMAIAGITRLQSIWHDLYSEWTQFALVNPLLTEVEPRLPVEDIRQSAAFARTLKKKALMVYQQFLNKPEAKRAAMGAAVAAKKEQNAKKRGSALKLVITVASILGGAASAHVLYRAIKKGKSLDHEADQIRQQEAESKSMATLAASIPPIAPLYPQGSSSVSAGGPLYEGED